MIKFASNQKKILLFVMIIITICELAISFYIPLLPTIREQLNASEYLIQQSVTVYLLGIGISAIIYGGLSDALGRRWIIITGITVFFISSLLCFWIQSVEFLIILRLCQGFGAGVAWAIGNATLRDVFEGKSFAKAMILIHIIAGIEPLFAYLLGSYIGSIIGWRNCFLVISITSFALLLCCLLYLPETIIEKKKLNLFNIFNNYYTLLKSKRFLLYLTIKVLAVSVLFVEVTNLSLVFIEQYGLSMPMFGINVTISIVFYIIGGFVNTKLIDYFTPEQIIKLGLLLLLISNLVLPIFIYFYSIPTYVIQFIKIPYSFGLALIFGNATYSIVNTFPKTAGTASAKMITLEMIGSSFFTYLLSLFYNNTLYPVIIFTIISSIISYIALKLVINLKS